MKETTFGDSPAAKTLAVMLTCLNNPKVSRSVSRFLISQADIAKMLAASPDQQLSELYRRCHLRIIRETKLAGVTGKIETFMKNVAVAKFRQKN